jgi:hypothetical protein
VHSGRDSITLVGRMSEPAPLITVPMKRWRTWLVAALAAVIVLGHGYDIAAQVEHWPFSFYPMYGRVQKKKTLQMLALYTVSPDPVRRRKFVVNRLIESKYVPPLNEVRMRNILMMSWGRDGTKPGAVLATAAVLRDFLRLYESRRVAGLHDGPPIVEAQLRRITWRVKPGAASRKPRAVDPLLGVRADGTVIDYAHPAASAASAPSDAPAH